MGLDMYLKKKTYIGAEYEHRNVRGKVNITIGNKPVKIDFNRISSIEESVGYWRKANQIHRWFVENIQDGKDDCGEYSLSKKKAVELLFLCKRVKELSRLKESQIHTITKWEGGKQTDVFEVGGIIENKKEIEKILPTASGFFFGSTEYDEYYLAEIDDTIEILERILQEDDESKDYFTEEIYYTSSW